MFLIIDDKDLRHNSTPFFFPCQCITLTQRMLDRILGSDPVRQNL